MLIIGADYHPGFQQIAFVDTETGELQERRLQHREEAEKFYRDLAVGMACVSTRAKWRALRSARVCTLKKYLTPPTLSDYVNHPLCRRQFTSI